MQNLSLPKSNSQPFIVDNHLSFNFNDHTNLNLTRFSSLTETKPYTPITGCVLEHILTTTDLTNHEKLYYLLADSLALINKNESHRRSCALPSEDWATYLGCSRSLIFTMQQNLEKKGYFIINKDWDKIGRNKRNLITPTLPTSVFNYLNEKFPDRIRDHAPYNPLSECKRSYLDRAKLFIKLNYGLLKIITSNEYLNPGQKIIWLSFYTRCYKNYMLQGREDFNVGKYSYNNDSSFSFISSYRELADLYSCNPKYLSKSIRVLEELGFIKTQNIYIRKRWSDNDDSCNDTYGVNNNYYNTQERQDQSLWKITLSLPETCILELEKVKDRSNLKLDDIKVTATDNIIDLKLIENCLILGGIKFNLNLEQASLLKSVIVDDSNISSSSDNYINSVIEELNVEDELEVSNNVDLAATFSKTLSSLETFDNKEENGDGIKSDPTIAKSGLLLNKDLKLKIKDIQSNLGLRPKVLFNEFLKRFRKKDDGNIEKRKEIEKEFNICSELIREKLKILPKDKADKARKFAYSLVSKKLATGYAASLSKNELAKQLIHHAATWKPTKLGSISREKEIDTALSVAWKAIVGGTWQVSLELAKAEVLQHEFRWYRRKYQESGVLSQEAKVLESDVNKLLGGWCDLVGKITEGAKAGDEKMESGDRNNKPIDVMKDECHRDRYFSTGIYTNEPLGLQFAEPDILTTDIFNIHPLNKEMIISNDYRLGKRVKECGNYELEQKMGHRVSQQNSPLCCGINEAGNNVNYQLHYDDLEIQQRNIPSFDLSDIPEEQKYLKVIPSDENGDDSMKLETINGREYFVKLKELEMNDLGEFIMTLKPVNKDIFLELNYIPETQLLPKSEINSEINNVDKR